MGMYADNIKRLLVQTGNIYDDIRASCVFAYNADTAGWSGNNYAPEVGAGNLVRTNESQTTGKIDEALRVNNNVNNIVKGNTILNADSGLFLKDGSGYDTDFTIHFWIKFDDEAADQYILSNRVITPRAGYLILVNSGELQIGQQGMVGGNIKTLGAFFPRTGIVENVFAFLAFTYTAATKTHTLKINDVAIMANSTSDDGFVSKGMTANDLYIGATHVPSIPTRGALDLFHIHNTKLTDPQLTALYNGGAGVKLY